MTVGVTRDGLTALTLVLTCRSPQGGGAWIPVAGVCRGRRPFLRPRVALRAALAWQRHGKIVG